MRRELCKFATAQISNILQAQPEIKILLFKCLLDIKNVSKFVNKLFDFIYPKIKIVI